MDYQFPADLQPFIDDMMAKGVYEDVYELILDAVYLLRDHELTRRRKYEELKKEIQIGIDQLDRGQVAPLDMDAIMAKVEERIRQRKGTP
jgi:antitoxin ParD1/3/4